MMELIMSANNNEQVVVFPYVPADVEINNPYEKEELITVKGPYTLLGDRKNKTLELEGWFFCNYKPQFAHPKSVDGKVYVDFFEKFLAKRVPFRVILVKDKVELVNMACDVEFSYYYDKRGDIKYHLLCTEFLFV